MSLLRRSAPAVFAALLIATIAAPANAEDYVPGRVVAKFASGQRAAALDRSDVGVDSVRSLEGLPGTAIVDLAPGQSVAGAVRELEATRGVVYAQPDYRVHVMATPNDPLFSRQWSLDNVGQAIGGAGLGPDTGVADDDVDAPEAWELTTGSRSVKIAVVDTGVDLTHEDLVPNEWVNPGETPGNGVDDDGNGFIDDTRGWNFATNSNNPGWPGTDVGAHGTHVAGIIGAVGANGLGVAGLNWATTIIPIASLSSSGAGSTSQIAQGFAYAGKNGARVVNASVGTCPQPAGTPPPSDERQAVRDYPQTLFVIAAGNAADPADCTISGQNDDDAHPVFPCNIPEPNVICVARSQADDSLAANSDFGHQSVHLAAPGGRILSTYPHGAGAPAGMAANLAADGPNGAYAFDNGTSMATPMVAGVIGLMLARTPGASADRVKTALLAAVDKKSQFADKTVSGGRLNAQRAVLAVGDVTGPTGVSVTGPADGTAATDGHTTVTWSPGTDSESGIDHYQLLVDGNASGSPTAGTTGSIDVGEGTHSLAVRAFDIMGNSSTSPAATFVVDRTPPGNPGGGVPLNNAFVNALRPALAWTAASDGGSGVAGYDVSLDGGPATRVPGTSFAPVADLGQGAHQWTVQAVDRAGNAGGSLTGAFSVDTVVPGRPGDAKPAGGTLRDRTPSLSWSAATDVGSGIDHYDVAIDGGAPARADATSFAPRSALDDGDHEWSVRAVDRAGNASAAAAGEFTIDSKAPRASASAASAGRGRLRVRCRTSEPGRCSVKVVASAATAKRLHLGRHSVTLGSASATLTKAGRSLTVRLSAKARAALRRAGSARVIARVTITDAAGNAAAKSVSVRAR